MKRLNDLKPPEGSRQEATRRGRGYGSGKGGHESGRGTKGQNARSGGKQRVGFEGGQTPIWRRFPKHGFTNPTKTDLQWVNVHQLNRFEEGEEVTPQTLMDAGLIDGVRDGLKILGKGELRKKLTVKAHQFSSGAKRKIEDAGGEPVLIE